MIKYREITIDEIDDNIIDNLYLNLLKEKVNLYILNNNNNTFILTKEKSYFKINNKNEFLDTFNKSIFYHTSIAEETTPINKRDLELFHNYLDKYMDKMLKHYGDYLFGSVAIKTDNNAFITTIRGKKNFDEYVLVTNVDHLNHIVYSEKFSPTLNAPLLDNIFKNNRVKAIVHINHYYDNLYPYYEYYLPGTNFDSERTNTKSFNIKHHGIIYLFDEDGNLI